ncbi:MAG: glycosyltransferase [Candidatus Omnitrophica bacterium]|nr:glycosyltransferase [Candidatus Omnitrophota bacterium]
MTLNEIEGMKLIMPSVRREWVDQILILDGGSTDGTPEWALGQGYEVHVQKEPGFRNGYREVWPKVVGDVVIYFTPDGNSLPEAIPQLLDKMEGGFDLVIASRYLGGARSKDDDLISGFGNGLFRALTNGLLNPRNSVRMTDPLVMLRAHRKDLPQRLGLDQDEPFVALERFFNVRKVDWIPLMSMRALSRGIRWGEIPVDEPARIFGGRKINLFSWGAVYLIQLCMEWKQFRFSGEKRREEFHVAG